MQQIIVAGNGKGGSGKTPTIVHLFYASSRRTGGKRLFLDTDPQATASFHLLGAKYNYQEQTLHEAILALDRVEPLHLTSSLYVLSAHSGLADAEDELTKNPAKPFQWRLSRMLKLYQDFDEIYVDTPGSYSSVFPILAYTAASKIIVPVKKEVGHQPATVDTMSLIEDVKENLNPDLVMWGLFPNQYEQNNRHHAEALGLIEDMKDPQGNPYPMYPRPSLKRTRYNDATGMHVEVSRFKDCTNLGSYWDEALDCVLSLRTAREVRI